jgi:hypothetical protein
MNSKECGKGRSLSNLGHCPGICKGGGWRNIAEAFVRIASLIGPMRATCPAHFILTTISIIMPGRGAHGSIVG